MAVPLFYLLCPVNIANVIMSVISNTPPRPSNRNTLFHSWNCAITPVFGVRKSLSSNKLYDYNLPRTLLMFINVKLRVCCHSLFSSTFNAVFLYDHHDEFCMPLFSYKRQVILISVKYHQPHTALLVRCYLSYKV